MVSCITAWNQTLTAFELPKQIPIENTATTINLMNGDLSSREIKHQVFRTLLDRKLKVYSDNIILETLFVVDNLDYETSINPELILEIAVYLQSHLAEVYFAKAYVHFSQLYLHFVSLTADDNHIYQTHEKNNLLKQIKPLCSQIDSLIKERLDVT